MSEESSGYDSMALDDPDTDSIFRLCMVDRKRKVRIEVKLLDPDGDEVPIKEALREITQYTMDKLKGDEPNDVAGKILPMMAESTATALPRLVGPGLASALIAQESVRYPLIHMMTVGFLLLKFIQKNSLKITTIEETLTDEEIEGYERLNRASNAAVLSSMLGGDPKSTLREMFRKGMVTKGDLEELMGDEASSIEEDETDEDEPTGRPD